MNRRGFFSATIAALAAVPGATAFGARLARAEQLPVPPQTRRKPEVIKQLGRVRIDEYAWLKDPHWKDVWRDPGRLSPEILRHLDEENAYSEAVLAPTLPLQHVLFAEMKRRSSGSDEVPPITDRDWLYYRRFPAHAEYPVYARRAARGAAAEEVLLDGPQRAVGHDYFSIPHVARSPDHRLFAWAEDDTGSEKFRIFVRDLATGELIPAAIEDAFGSFTFSGDSAWLYWIWRDANSRPRKLFRRPARGGEDVLVYEETDPGYFMTLTRSRSNAFMKIRLLNGTSSEVRLIAATDPTATPRLIEERRPLIDYDVEDWNGRLVVRTNADGATDFKLMWADADSPGRDGWRDFISHRPGHSIENVLAFQDHLVRLERVDANPVLIVTERATLAERAIGFAEQAYSVAWDEESDYSAPTLRLSYQSPRTPREWYDEDLLSKQRRLVARATVPGGFDPDRYRVRRLFASAPDGAQVPMTVVMRRDARVDGTLPLLLHGYGSYGFSTEADFSVPALSLIDRGWIYAIAHVRGGSEKGHSWYLQAIQAGKPRTFTDFIACAKHLIAQRYTRAGQIVAHGLSAGGLLVGASANLRPDLWAGIIGQAPYVDALNTMSDAEHPLVPLARPDWGDPLADPAAYDTIAGYSPYENVHRQAYPAVLATSSVADDRVGYWEPAKWIAKLRECSTSGRPVLLRVSIRGGHLGAAGRFESMRQQALFWAFADWAINTGAKPAASAG